MYGFWWYKPLDVKFSLFLNIQHPTGLRRPHVTSEQHDGTSSVASDGPVGEHATPNRSNKPSLRAKQLTLEPEETPGFRPEVKLQSTETRGTVPEYKLPLPPLPCNFAGKRWRIVLQKRLDKFDYRDISDFPLPLRPMAYVIWITLFPLIVLWRVTNHSVRVGRDEMGGGNGSYSPKFRGRWPLGLSIVIPNSNQIHHLTVVKLSGIYIELVVS